ncbi:MAG: hypothetical protein RMK20_06995 [Verrucomicrobiales bacterium]|nr:hypothetical protein [Verrucomicrobiales bacterium]
MNTDLLQLAGATLTVAFWLRFEHRLTTLETRIALDPRLKTDYVARAAAPLSVFFLSASVAMLLASLTGCSTPRPPAPTHAQVPTLYSNAVIPAPSLPDGPSQFTVEEHRKVTLGLPAAQIDRTAELTTRARQVRPVQAAGIAMILAAIGMFTPWIRPLIGSVTTPVLTLATGTGLLVLSSLLPRDNAPWLLLLCVLPLAYWFVHRHARATATLTNPLDNRAPR